VNGWKIWSSSHGVHLRPQHHKSPTATTIVKSDNVEPVRFQIIAKQEDNEIGEEIGEEIFWEYEVLK
jgi:hypothetical protein